MAELTMDFQSLPDRYQQIIQLAQNTYNITIAPLQVLAVVLKHPASDQNSLNRPNACATKPKNCEPSWNWDWILLDINRPGRPVEDSPWQRLWHGC